MKKFLSSILTISIIISVLPANIAKAYIDNFNILDDYITDYYGSDSELTIPNQDEIYSSGSRIVPIHGISLEAFMYNENLTSVIIPDNIRSIGNNAFNGCTNLSSITMSENIQDIGYDAFKDTAFYNNKNNWENGALYIGNCLISADPSFSGEFEIKDGTQVIASNAFEGCYNITNITIPDSVRYIGKDAIKRYNFHYTFESNYDEDGFLYLNGWLLDVRGVFDPDSDKYIIPSDYTVKEGTKGIAGGAFTSYLDLTSITLPDGLTTICDSAFSGINTLTKVNFPDSLEIIGTDAFSGTGLTEIEIPRTVKIIEYNSFSWCDNLERVVFKEGVSTISYSAFSLCKNLKTLVIPKSVWRIGGSSFSWCDNLETIYYSGTTSTWISIFGTTLNPNIPYELSEADLIISYDVPSFTPTYVPVGINEVTVTCKGTAYAKYVLTNKNGTDVARKKVVYYSIDGSPKKSVRTDINGCVSIPVTNITESKDYDIVITGPDIQNITGTVKVTVEDLKFSSKYEASVITGKSVGIGAGVGAEVSEFEAESSLAEANAGGSKETIISVSQEYKNKKNNLKITAKRNSNTFADGKIGLFGKVDAVDIIGAEVNPLEISGKLTTGNFAAISLEFDDFDINNTDDLMTLGKFMFCVSSQQLGSNLLTNLLAEKLDVPINSYERGFKIAGDLGTAVGTFELKTPDGNDMGEVSLNSLNAKAVISNSTVTDSDFNPVEYTNSLKTEDGYSVVDFKMKNNGMSGGSSVFGTNNTIDDVAVTAKKDSDGTLTDLEYVMTDTQDNSIFWNKDTITKKAIISYSDSNAQNVAEQYDVLHDFTTGWRPLFAPWEWDTVSETMLNSYTSGIYNSTVEHLKGIDINLSAKIKVLANLGIQLGVSGIQGYEYNLENGIIEDNTVYVQAKNDIEKKVEEKFLGIEDLTSLALLSISDYVEDLLESAGEVLDDVSDKAVRLGQAVVKKADEEVTNFFVKISSIGETIMPVSILSIEDESSLYSTSSLATTIGNPYVVTVEDANGNIITDLSENPLILTLEYTDEQLHTAGVTNVNDLHIMYWDNDKCVYVNMGGEHNPDTKSLSLEITKPGQYILAVDNCPPAITEFKSSDSGITPEITATVSDMSGISDFIFKIDNTELVNTDNLEDYYDFTTGKFSYVTNELSDGTHTAKILAVDSLENTVEESIDFSVSRSVPIIKELSVPENLSDGSEINAVITDDNLTNVYLNLEYPDTNGNIKKDVVEMSGYENQYWTYLYDLPVGMNVKIWVSAYNSYGNSAESEIKEVYTSPLQLDITPNLDYNYVYVQVNDITGLEDSILVLAEYDSDGILLSTQMSDIESYMDIYTDTDTYKSIKIFVWNKNMKSLHEVVSYEKSE